jgi:hypothetical protein
MSKYIIKNCPAIFKHPVGHWNCQQGKECQDCTDCLLKRIYEDVKTVYRTPEYFEELAKKGDREQELIESAWHNVAHMVISKLDVQDILE